LQRRAHLAPDLTDHRQKQEEVERTCAGSATRHGGRKPAAPGGARESPAPYIKAGKWHTFSGSEPIVDSMQLFLLPGHPPDTAAMNFRQRGKQSCFGATSSMQCASNSASRGQGGLRHRPDCAAATRNQLLPQLAREDVWIAGPYMNVPALGRLRQEGSGYSQAPMVFADQWNEHAPSPQK
jgi:hypothetical protein